MQYLRRTIRIDVQLEDRRALGAEGSLVVRAARIALDVDDLAVDGVDEGAAADRAIRTNARRDLGVLDPELLCPRHYRAEIDPGTDQPAKRRRASRRQLKSEENPGAKFP